MQRRTFVVGSAALLAGAAFPRAARANVPTPYSADLQPPTTSREAFIKWAVENRGENPRILAARWDRYVFLRANNDFINARNGRAFLLTSRDSCSNGTLDAPMSAISTISAGASPFQARSW